MRRRSRFRVGAVAVGFACATSTARSVLAQTAPVSPRPGLVRVELVGRDVTRFELRTERRAPPLTCGSPCTLTVVPGHYWLGTESDPRSDLREVHRQFDIADDTWVNVRPGSRVEHAWGLGLTIGGSVAFGLGAIFFIAGHMSGAEPSPAANIFTYSMLGGGAVLGGGGIYLLVRGRNRVEIEPFGPAVLRARNAGRAFEIGYRGQF